jgi:hypothetical protein
LWIAKKKNPTPIHSSNRNPKNKRPAHIKIPTFPWIICFRYRNILLGDDPMPAYRIYWLDQNDHVTGADWLIAEVRR